MSDMKTYSILIAWNDNDKEEGDYGATVRAINPEEAEALVRQQMAEDDEFFEPGEREFGSVLDLHEGAIWKAADLEAALRDMRTAYGRLHDFLSDAIEGGRLKEADLPDDYQAIVAQLEACAAADHKAKAIIAEIDLEIDR